MVPGQGRQQLPAAMRWFSLVVREGEGPFLKLDGPAEVPDFSACHGQDSQVIRLLPPGQLAGPGGVYERLLAVAYPIWSGRQHPGQYGVGRGVARIEPERCPI